MFLISCELENQFQNSIRMNNVRRRRLNRLSEGLMGSPMSQVPTAVILGLVASVLVAEMLFFANFLVLVRADVSVSQNRKYVEYLILEPFLASLHPC